MFLKDNSQDKFYVTYAKAVSREVILSIILFSILGLVFYFTNLNENYMESVVWIITILSICYGGIYGAFKIGQRGYLHGAVIGAIYMLILFLIAVLAEKGQVSLVSYGIRIVMSLIIGSLSGMIGIVLNNK